VNLNCKQRAHEIYGRIKGTKTNLAALANDPTDYKALIAQAKGTTEKVALAQKLATRRLAIGVVPELDVCFSALEPSREPANHHQKALIAEALVDMASLVDQMKTAAETPKRWARALACRALI